MKLVPGFLVTHADGNGANPLAVYHGDFDTLYRRMQVFIDGRSVFSSLLVGSTSHGLMGVILDDIDYIEVHRGPNSASYGANAFYGVINIVTRHAEDTQGVMLSQSLGQGGVHDSVAQIGGGEPGKSFRLSASQQRDNGFTGNIDDLDLKQVHLRGDVRVSPRDDLSFSAGYVRHEWGSRGEPGKLPPVTRTVDRTEAWRNFSLQGSWLHKLSEGNDIRINASHDEEQFFNYISTFKADGLARRTSLEGQYTTTLSPSLRTVVGAEVRNEDVVSESLFATNDKFSASLLRVFGNAEWRASPRWIFNGGGTYERHNLTGDRVAPRLAANVHVTPEHTLRAVRSIAYRMPTLFELKGDWRTGFPAILPTFVKAKGGARPEKIDASEIGYFGELRDYRLTLDLRKFEENIDNLTGFDAGPGGLGPTRPNDVVNVQIPRIRRGWEGQLRWKPTNTTDIRLNHSVVRIEALKASDIAGAPTHFSTLTVFQDLPARFELGIIYTTAGQMTWVTMKDMLPPIRQLDIQLAKHFSIGTTKAEAAVKLRAVNGAHPEFVADPAKPIPMLDRRAIATLRLFF
jgi:iron complex outermembrane receptor protein